MDEIDNEHVDRLFESLHHERRQTRRQLERVTGAALIIVSLVMAALFLAALGSSENSLLVQSLSVVSLIIAVGLFALGLQHALIGRR